MRAQVLAVLACVSLVSGCGGDDVAPADNAVATSQPSATAPSTPSERPVERAAEPDGPPRVLRSADSEFGEMLFDRSGQAIYLFDKDTTAKSRCDGACAEAWPPVLTHGSPRGVAGVRSELLGTTSREDGTTQVTYAGHPLYFYAHEGKNEVLCHNVTGFGGLWLVVTPHGEPGAH